jgi:hypothetical protein|tara:strand:+ start:6294 stop:6476 length:183 start_codon:yes stop_codon:yes gene_type:complete
MKDLYEHLKGKSKKINPVDFKESIFDLCTRYLKSRSLTPDQMQKIARLRAYIDINFKKFL